MPTVTVGILSDLRMTAEALRDDLEASVSDETMMRAMKTVVDRLRKYETAARSRKQKALTTEEIEAHSHEG